MPNNTHTIYYRSYKIALRITLSGKYVVKIEFIDPEDPEIDLSIQHIYLQKVDDYFWRRSKGLDLPYLLETTPFRAKVYEVVKQIPYGRMMSYGEVAARVGSPKAARAVGSALMANPLPLIIPCHRVVGRRGQLVGYTGGLIIKNKLLDLEDAQ